MSRKTELLMEVFQLQGELGKLALPEATGEVISTPKGDLFLKLEIYYRLLYELSVHLGKTAYEMYFTAKILPGLIMTRELMTHAAIFLSLIHALEKTLNTGNAIYFKKEVDGIFNPKFPEGPVLDGPMGLLVDQANQNFQWFNESFTQLLDCLYPGRKLGRRAGRLVDTGSIGQEHLWTTDDSACEIGLKNLLAGLSILVDTFRHLVFLHPRFAAFCGVPGGDATGN